jgi:hypothetical protein
VLQIFTGVSNAADYSTPALPHARTKEAEDQNREAANNPFGLGNWSPGVSARKLGY